MSLLHDSKLNRRDALRILGVSSTAIIGGVGVGSGGASAAPVAIGRGATGARQAGDAVRFAMVGDFIPSFYPLGTWTGNQFLLYNLVFSTLVELDVDLNLRGDLAESWEISEDATTFTFHLRQNVTWHDGQPFTSKDVAFSFKYYLRDPQATGFTSRLQQLVGAADYMSGATDELPGIETPDDYTVVLKLAQPNAFFIKALREPFHFILPQHILEGVNPEELQTHPFATESPTGTGPYRVVSVQPDQYVELEAYPNYFLGAPRVAKVFQKFLPAELVLAQLESGELDLGLRLNPLEYDRLESSANLEAIARPGVGVVELIVNNLRITDKRTRQAIYYALDRQGMIDALFGGRGKLLKAPPAMTDYPDLNEYAYNPETAQQLLAESGFDTSQTIRLIYDTAWPAVSTTVPIIEQQLEAIGFNVELEPLDTTAWVERYRNQPDSWELAWGQGGTEALDPDVSTIYYTNDPKTAIGYYTNDELNELFIQGRSTGDQAKRDEIYQQVAKIINDEAPVIYLWTPYDVHGKVQGLQGVTVHPYAPETTNDAISWNWG